MPASYSAGLRRIEKLTDPTETYTYPALLRAKPIKDREDHLQGAKGHDKHDNAAVFMGSPSTQEL